MTDNEVLLVLSAQAGDAEAFAVLLQRLHRPLRAYLVSLVGPSCADDVLQDSALQIYRKLRWLDDPCAFKAWAYRIATRNAFATLRRERVWRDMDRDPSVLEAIAEPTPPLSSFELAQVVTKRIASVPPASRIVLLLHYQQELTLDETAAALDLKLGTVKSRLAYGINFLRKQFKGENGNDLRKS